jgi:subtilisin family serine protease
VGWISRQRKDVAALVGAIAVLALAPAAIAHASKTPNDPGFPRQWGDENTGQSIPELPAGIPFADDSASEAWGITTGSSSIVIGETDTGVNWELPDLSENVWTNPAAGVGGCPAGTRGFDVLSLTERCEPRDEDNSLGGHGSHVAGIMGAVGNNGLGVAGMNWHTSIVPVKWLDQADTENAGENEQQYLAKALQVLIEIKEAGVNVRVVNDSTVFKGTTKSGAVEQAIKELGEHNILFVTAAGNQGENNDEHAHFPCDYHLPNEICVTASNNRDELPSWADYGPNTVDLAAPGARVYSTLRNGQDDYRSGTSMAAAQVSGAAALILSAQEMSATELRADLLSHVDKRPTLEGKVATGGRLDVCKAMPGCTDATGAPPPPPRAPEKWPAPTPRPVPVLSGLTIAPSTFRAAKTGASISSAHVKRGAIVSYSDTLAALTEFTVVAPRAGILNSAKKCVAPPRHRPAHGRRAKSCVRYLRSGSFERIDTPGLNKFHFSGRVGNKKLPPGRYRLQAVPVFGPVTGAAAVASFRIIK